VSRRVVRSRRLSAGDENRKTRPEQAVSARIDLFSMRVPVLVTPSGSSDHSQHRHLARVSRPLDAEHAR
jgi:hypothetical protein